MKKKVFINKKQQVKYSNLRKQRILEARKKGTHTNKEWQELLDEFPYCVRCLEKTQYISKDHIVPIYQGGSDSIENIQPICRPCNMSKGPETLNWKELRRKEKNEK